METARKITLEVPLDLLGRAQASGTGVTQTVRAGLQLVAASRTLTLSCENFEVKFASREHWQS